MITVTKTIYRYADGRKRVEKISFQVLNLKTLEAKRQRDMAAIGCADIRYVYYDTEKQNMN